jgi:MFS family permease
MMISDQGKICRMRSQCEVQRPPDIGSAGQHFQLLLLAAAMGAGGYIRTAVSPLQETIRIALALSDNQIALLQGPVIAVPVALAAIPLGLFIDRYSRRRLLIALTALSMIGSLCTACALNYTELLLARGLTGLTGLAIQPVVFSILADLYPATRRGRATTAVVIGQVAGNSAAFALGGVLIAMTGHAPDGWRWAMLWLIAPLAPVVLLMLTLREPERMGLVIERRGWQIWRELWRYRARIGPVVIGVILVEMAVGAMLIWAAPMFSRNFGLPPDHVGTIMAMGMLVSGILGPIVGGTLADLCNRTGGPSLTLYVLTGIALMGVPAGMFGCMPEVVSAGIVLVVDMTIMLAAALMAITLFNIVIPNELRGLCMAVLVAAILLCALGAAPLSVSVLAGAIGGLAKIGIALSIVCVTTSLLAAMAFVCGRRHFVRAVADRCPGTNGVEPD